MSVLQRLLQSSSFFVALLFMTGFADVIQAKEITQLKIEHVDGRFIIHANILIAAPLSRVRAVLTDFENLSNLNPNIKTVNILDNGDADQIRMQVQSRTCILFFCLDYQWVQETQVLASDDIITYFDPDFSDFHKGWVRYRLLAEGNHTRLVTDADLVPSFWIPPLLGPALIKKTLQQESIAIALRIEELTHLQPSSASMSLSIDRFQLASSPINLPVGPPLATH